MKNILLLFLSDVKTIPINGKLVISEAHYENVEGESTKTTNESAVRYISKRVQLDKIFIFASKKVRSNITHFDRDTKKILPFLVDGEPQTHLDFSLARFKKFLPDVDCFILDYDENNLSNENLQSVAEMARHVQEFAGDDEVTLHVDLTGGMRHVNMLMLELTRLLEYSGLKVDKVIYSNYEKGIVEEIQNVYDLFQLIAGVEEFVNFGSVHALEKYYSGRKISPPLEKLRNAMKNFAEAIKLCHYGQFSETIIKLHDAVNDFNKHAPADVEDILMARLIGRIHDNYQDLISIREKDDVRVIRWCLANGYLQQALTLYTERIPEYLGENNFISQSEEQARNLSKLVEKDKMRRNNWFYLFSEVKQKDDKLARLSLKYYDALKDEAWNAIKKKNFEFNVWLKNLNEKIKPLNISPEEELKLRSKLETLAEVFKAPELLLDLQAAHLEPIRKLINLLSEKLEQETKGFKRKKIIADFMEHAPIKELDTIFEGLQIVNLLEKYSHAKKMHELFLEETFSVNIPLENFLSITDKYFRIKTERNNTNHAKECPREFETAEKLRDFMSAALTEIENNMPAQ